MRRFSDWPVRLKLVVSSCLASSLALALACSAFVIHARLTFPSALARELEVQADIIGRNSASAVIFGDPRSAANTLEALKARDYIVAGAIYSSSGARFASYTAPTAAPLPESIDRWLADRASRGGHVSVRKSIVLDHDSVGSVVLEGDLREMRARTLEFSAIALGVLFVSLAAAVAISFRLQHAIARPILELTDVARAVSGRQDYSIRARVVGGDEIGFLVRTFNRMLGHIEERGRALEKARDQALDASRLKSAFLANMSHEIRTPLNIILGYNELVDDYLKDNGGDEMLPALDAVRRAGQRLIETIDSILEISRIEAGAFELNRVPIAVADTVRRCVEEAKVLAQRKGLELVTELRAPEARVLFDEHCLSHLLMNLLSNAIKFTDAGRITVGLERDAAGDLQLSVTDTGVGIAEEYLPKLFEPFSQEEIGTTRRFEGTGLGLALVKSYAELNGARLSVTSTKGVGSSFCIHFARELSDPAKPARAEDTARQENAAPRAARERPTVLVVEDDAATQTYMKTLLGRDYEVLIAGSAPDARRMFEFHGRLLRAVLMDVALKGDEDGLVLTRWMREQPTGKTIPIIATTAHALPEDRVKALDSGCDAYLAKPLRRQQLFQLLSELIAGRFPRAGSRPDAAPLSGSAR
jgi:signal transduction histidine kinase/CheY-like chemotaxis protein